MARKLLHVILLLALAAVGFALPRSASAQDPAEMVEALALRAHLQNLRADNYTFWIGGNLGDPRNAPVQAPLGEVIDGWTLRGLAGDDDLVPGDLTRPTLLNFWASWCPPCRIEFPHLVRVAMAPEDHAFDVVFVNTSDEEDSALSYLAQYAPEIRTVVDTNDRLSRRLLIQSIPTSLLIDTDGTVLAAHVGILTPTISDFFDAVAANPGVGSFVASNHANDVPTAELAPVDADSATPIQYGERVLDSLDSQHFQQAYRFEGHAGDSVTVDLAADSSTLDPYVVLMAADGTRLAENDDADLGSGASVTVTLPADGTYLVVATRFLEAEGFSAGDYSLTVTLANGSAAQEEGMIAYGSTVSGRVSGNDPREFYSFEGHAGDVVTLRVTHTPDPVALTIEVKDPALNRLAISDESVDGEAALVDLELPQDGSYLVVVSRPRSRDQANLDYTLSLEAQNSPGALTPTPVYGDPIKTPGGGEPQQQPDAPTLAYGDTVTGTLSGDHFEDRWTFEGQVGDVITLIMTRTVDARGGLDGTLLLIGPGGDTLVEQDDYRSDVMPRIEQFTLPADGVYTVVATRFGFASGFSEGEYTLALEQVAGLPVDAGRARWITPDSLPPDLRRIAYNSQAIGSLSAEDFDDWYVFSGSEGDVITVRMTSASLDPFLVLVDSNGYEVAKNDDLEGSTTESALVDVALPATGTYLLRATRYGFEHGLSGGDYRLVIETDAAPVDPGDQIPAVALGYGEVAGGALALDHLSDRYTFTHDAGTLITIVAQRTTGDLDLALALRGPDGSDLALERDWIDSSEARLAHYTLPQDGTYTLEVLLEDPNTSGDYRLIILPAAPESGDTGTLEPAPGLDIEVTLVWGSRADLTLSVSSPADTSGDPAPQITARANDFCAEQADVPTERMVWDQDSAAPGLYTVGVQYELDCAASGEPVWFMLALTQNSQTIRLVSGTLLHEGDRYTTLLDYSRP